MRDEPRIGSPLLEREGELERLASLLEATLDGHGGVILVEGPAGVGKTRLLGATGAPADERALTILRATAAELEAAYAFGICHQLLDSAVNGLDRDERNRVLSGAAGRARPLFEQEAAQQTAPGADPLFPVIHGLYWLIANLAESAPMVLLVDDAQWADGPSLRFLDYLARRVEGLPVALVLAARAGERESEPELLRTLRAQPTATRLRLRPLSADAVTEIVRDRYPEASQSFCRTCAAATGGNPFYLHEVLSHPAAAGAVGPPNEPDQLAVDGLESIASDVQARAARLDPEAASLAAAAAILGEGTPLRRAAVLAGMDADAAARAADLLAAAEVLRLDGERLGFVHPIVRQSVYAGVPAARRARDHARAAEILHAEGGEGDAAASQLLLAERNGEGWAVGALRAAAADANRRGAPEIAVRYLRRALEEPPPSGELAQVMLETGLAEMLSGDPSSVEHLREALEGSSDPGTRLGAASALAAALVFNSRASEAASVLKGVLDESGADPAMLMWLRGELVSMGFADLGARAVVAEDLAAARAEFDASGQATSAMLAILGFEALTDSTAEEASKLAERALGEGQLMALSSPEHPAVFYSIATLLVTDRGREAERYIAQAAEKAAASGSVRAFGAVACLRSRASFRWGRIPEAEAEARTAIEIIREHQWSVGVPVVIVSLLDPLIERGEWDEAERALTTLDLEQVGEDQFGFQQLRESRARLHLERGRHAEALDDALACGAWERDWGASNSVISHYPWRSTAALARMGLGEPEAARALAAEAVEIAERFGDPHLSGVAHRVAGITEEGDSRLAHLRTSVERLEHSCSRLEYAKALADLGTALRLARRRRDSREPLTLALDLAHRCGATALQTRAREELLAAGARPRTPLLSGVDALTPSERRVAAMAAEGMSNPEIAQALFVTRKTVEMHLSNAYRKLDVSGRDQLAGALAGPAAAEPASLA